MFKFVVIICEGLMELCHKWSCVAGCENWRFCLSGHFATLRPGRLMQSFLYKVVTPNYILKLHVARMITFRWIILVFKVARNYHMSSLGHCILVSKPWISLRHDYFTSVRLIWYFLFLKRHFKNVWLFYVSYASTHLNGWDNY